MHKAFKWNPNEIRKDEAEFNNLTSVSSTAAISFEPRHRTDVRYLKNRYRLTIMKHPTFSEDRPHWKPLHAAFKTWKKIKKTLAKKRHTDT